MRKGNQGWRGTFLLGTLALALVTSGCGEEKRRFEVELSGKDAVTLAAVILNQGRVRGCGDFEVAKQWPAFHEIVVMCNDGEKSEEHRVQYYPEFKVDGRSTVENTWDRTWLGDAFCVKRSDGKWDAAFIQLDSARDRAEKISQETDLPTQIYAAAQNLFWQSFKNDDGKWVVYVPIGEVRDDSDRVGCEFD